MKTLIPKELVPIIGAVVFAFALMVFAAHLSFARNIVAVTPTYAQSSCQQSQSDGTCNDPLNQAMCSGGCSDLGGNTVNCIYCPQVDANNQCAPEWDAQNPCNPNIYYTGPGSSGEVYESIQYYPYPDCTPHFTMTNTCEPLLQYCPNYGQPYPAPNNDPTQCPNAQAPDCTIQQWNDCSTTIHNGTPGQGDQWFNTFKVTYPTIYQDTHLQQDPTQNVYACAWLLTPTVQIDDNPDCAMNPVGPTCPVCSPKNPPAGKTSTISVISPSPWTINPDGYQGNGNGTVVVTPTAGDNQYTLNPDSSCNAPTIVSSVDGVSGGQTVTLPTNDSGGHIVTFTVSCTAGGPAASTITVTSPTPWTINPDGLTGNGNGNVQVTPTVGDNSYTLSPDASCATPTVTSTVDGVAGGSTVVLPTNDAGGHAVNFNVSCVTPFSYTIGQPSNVTIPIGSSGTTNIPVTLTSGNAQVVSFSPSGAPSGISVSFTSCTPSPNCISTGTISVGSGVSTGVYLLTVTSGPSPAQTRSFTITVTPGPLSPTGDPGTHANPNPDSTGQQVTWTSCQATGGTPPLTYTWSGTDITTPIVNHTNTLLYTYATQGIKFMNVKITDTNGGEVNCNQGSLKVVLNATFQEF